MNQVRIQAYPSHHVSTMRGFSPSFIFLDEAVYFSPGEQQVAKIVAERYIGKSNPYIISGVPPGRRRHVLRNRARTRRIGLRYLWKKERRSRLTRQAHDVGKQKHSKRLDLFLSHFPELRFPRHALVIG